jgi:L,D-transpeptidase catalytic domain/Putative peptidoglycan binding domain
VIDRVKQGWQWSERSLRRVFWHRWLAVAVVVVLVALGGVVAAGYGYAQSQDDMIAKGVRVGTINLSGLSATEARKKLTRVFKPLGKPLVLRYKGGHLLLSPRQARVRLDVDELVSQALARSHRGSFLTRAWRQLTGGRVESRIRPRVRYSRSVILSVVDKLKSRVEKKPVNAVLIPSYDRLVLKGGNRGIEVKAAKLRWQMRHALSSRFASRTIRVPVRKVEPEVTVESMRRDNPSYITIDRGNFTLRVYDHLRFVKSYGIAVGQAGLETPAGVYHIQDKQVDPWWHVPNSAWAGSLAGQVIPPGPSDPLKARWMGLFNGAGIHGTDQDWSIGQAVSHGCVRMHIPDVIDLYDRVSVGTPVYIGN